MIAPHRAVLTVEALFDFDCANTMLVFEFVNGKIICLEKGGAAVMSSKDSVLKTFHV